MINSIFDNRESEEATDIAARIRTVSVGAPSRPWNGMLMDDAAPATCPTDTAKSTASAVHTIVHLIRRAQVTRWADEMLSEAPNVQAYRGSSLRAYCIAFVTDCSVRIAGFGRGLEGLIHKQRAQAVCMLWHWHV